MKQKREGKGGAETGRMRVLACGPRTDEEAMNQGEFRRKLKDVPNGKRQFLETVVSEGTHRSRCAPLPPPL